METINFILSIFIVMTAFAVAIGLIITTHRNVRREVEKVNQFLKQVEQLQEKKEDCHD